MSWNTYAECYFSTVDGLNGQSHFLSNFPQVTLPPSTPEQFQVLPVAIKFPLPLGVICVNLHIYKYMAYKHS